MADSTQGQSSLRRLIDPAGPFRILRHLITTLILLSIGLNILGIALGIATGEEAWLELLLLFDIFIFPWIGLAWGVLWFLDVVLSYLKE